MEEGKIALGIIFLIVAAYLVFVVSGVEAKMFGGGIMGILGILTLYKGIKGEEESK